MADDLTAIPTDLYFEMRDELGTVKCMVYILVIILTLLICTLVDKSVLSSWTEIFQVTRG